MSFSNAPDARTLGRVAGALAVDEAFVEKDWYVIQAIRLLLTLQPEGITPIFSGGTALLKGHALIKRFSEDIDFKLALTPAFLEKSGSQQRKAVGQFKDALVSAWTDAGFQIGDVVARDSNGFIQIELTYPSLLNGHDALRPHILAEFSDKPPRLPNLQKPLSSFVSQYRSLPPEIPAIGCVDPVETAADKLSAFTWRVLARDRTSESDDPTIVRHIHDLAALEHVVMDREEFPALLSETLLADAHRGGGILKDLTPKTGLEKMLAALDAGAGYVTDYDRYVGGMAFAGAAEVPTYAKARETLARLCALLPD